jgi:hypothetical protein
MVAVGGRDADVGTACNVSVGAGVGGSAVGSDLRNGLRLQAARTSKAKTRRHR